MYFDSALLRADLKQGNIRYVSYILQGRLSLKKQGVTIFTTMYVHLNLRCN